MWSVYFSQCIESSLEIVHHFKLSLVCTLCQHAVSSIVMSTAMPEYVIYH